MPDLTEAAANISKAIAGKPPEAYAQVRATDVLALCHSLDAGSTNNTTDALLLGASGAAKLKPDIEVHQPAGALAELLRIAGA